MRTSTFLIIIFICLLPVASLFAQQKDAALWTNIYLEKKFRSKHNIHLNLLSRMTENFSQLSYAYADGGFTFRITRFLHSNLDYVFIRNRQLEGYYTTRHQFYFNLVFRKEIRRYKFLYRSMVQAQVRQIHSSADGKRPVYVHRHKFTVKYDLNKYFTPYLAQEFYFHLGRNAPGAFYRSRSFAGVFYNISNRSAIELYYVIQKAFNVYDPVDVYAIGLGFSHQF